MIPVSRNNILNYLYPKSWLSFKTTWANYRHYANAGLSSNSEASILFFVFLQLGIIKTKRKKYIYIMIFTYMVSWIAHSVWIIRTIFLWTLISKIILTYHEPHYVYFKIILTYHELRYVYFEIILTYHESRYVYFYLVIALWLNPKHLKYDEITQEHLILSLLPWPPTFYNNFSKAVKQDKNKNHNKPRYGGAFIRSK